MKLGIKIKNYYQSCVPGYNLGTRIVNVGMTDHRLVLIANLDIHRFIIQFRSHHTMRDQVNNQ